jgi:lipoprotein-anchoring transpeptidase ErfK/SrfK
MLKRQVVLSAYDVLTDETFSWTLGRSDVVTWLRIEQTADGPTVQVDPAAVRTTLADLAAGLGQGRGWRLEEATAQVVSAFDNGGGSVSLYLTHPPRIYVVQPGDTISSIAAASGMPTWLILRANPAIDPNWLHVGQELTIPSQDLLTPYLPVPGKRITVSIAEQRMRAYENGTLIYDWPVSTGIADSPTSTGVFQILGKEENAYASLWDLWMPHFMAIYPAGPDFYNGFHGLPTLSNGRRLWEGLLGSPASYGCIILGLEEAETFYGWAEVGVVVVIE